MCLERSFDSCSPLTESEVIWFMDSLQICSCKTSPSANLCSKPEKRVSVGTPGGGYSHLCSRSIRGVAGVNIYPTDHLIHSFEMMRAISLGIFVNAVRKKSGTRSMYCNSSDDRVSWCFVYLYSFANGEKTVKSSCFMTGSWLFLTGNITSNWDLFLKNAKTSGFLTVRRPPFAARVFPVSVWMVTKL